METVEIKFDLTNTDYAIPLGFVLQIDDKIIEDIAHVKNETVIHKTINLDEGMHRLQLTMKNKTQNHTIVDENNNIIQDAMLKVDNFILDKIELHNTFLENTVYHHDFNGTGKPIKDLFFGEIGCNGTVVFEFTSPIYIWFLEKM